MGGSNSAERQSRQNQQRLRGDPEHDLLRKPQHQSQEERELRQVTHDIWRQDYHDLMLKYDGLKGISAAQEKEIAFYRQTIMETASDEIFRRLDEVQNQLREFSVSLDRFTSEDSRIFQENNKRSQQKVSMRDNLDRLTRALLAMAEENKALKEGHRLITDRPLQLEKEDFASEAESGEQVPSGASTIHRKKATSDLRSQPVESHRFQLRGPHEQLVHGQGGPGDLLGEIAATRAELLALQSKLKSAETHIINIGGNLGALLPRETFKNEFNSVVGAIQIWVTTCMRPSTTQANPEQSFQAYERPRNFWARKTSVPVGFARLRDEDFRAASKFPGADESIFLVMIFDLLNHYIFSARFLYANRDLQKEIDVIKQLEPSIRLSSESSKSLYNARRWMSEAMTAFLAREETQSVRDDFSHELADFILRTVDLEGLLGPKNQAALDAATLSIRQDVVLPAIELGDKMACAIDNYSLEVPPYWSDTYDFQTRFFHDLGNLDCKNFGEGPTRFRLEKMQQKWSDDEIQSQLRAICPAIPALILTEIDDRKWGPPTILVKQQVWVSWHPKRKSTQRPRGQG